MSYTTINIKGQTTGLKFGYECNKWFFTAYVDNFETYTDGENLSLIGFAKLFHCAYRNNCAIKEIEPTFSGGDFYEWMEENLITEEGKEKFASIVSVWSETQNTKDIVGKLQALRHDEEKKTMNVSTT